MKNIKYKILQLIIFLLLVSCEQLVLDKNYENTPTSNFEVLWKTLDERYSYFSLKGIDWDSVYQNNEAIINNNMSNNQLWEVLTSMLCACDDGHLNLYSEEEIWSRQNCKSNKHNVNFDYSLVVNNYLKKPLKYSGPLIYNTFDSIGYFFYPSFASKVSEIDIDFLINHFKNTKGIIIDIRGNGGGDSENGDLIESRLLESTTLVEYIYHKNGLGHDDFTLPTEVTISPKGDRQYINPIAVLINHDSFSSSSFFASRMSVLPHVALIGDQTSGGAGRPKYFDLPNGWMVRYSSNYALRPDGLNFENGVPPDYFIELNETDKSKGIDTIIEFAKTWINQQ